ncbi:MAG: hypothetical protein AB4352_22780 [Hormoscilla sp.]
MVELTDEREQHIYETHPDLVPAYLQQMADTLANPEQVQVSRRSARVYLYDGMIALKGVNM